LYITFDRYKDLLDMHGSTVSAAVEYFVECICLKGRLSTFPLHVHSSFTHPLEVRSVSFSPNSSAFRYVPIKEKSVVIGASQEMLVS